MASAIQDAPRTSFDSSAASTSTPAASRVLGTMVVLVMRAKNLQNRVKLGKQNPYATVTFGLNKKRTAAIERGGQQPTWDAEFRFEIMKDPMDQLRDDAQAIVDKRGGVMPVSSAGTPSKVKEAASQTNVAVASGAATGKRILRIAVYADDLRDPRLVGEGTLDLEDVIKKGTFDGWVSLERKSRYAGEVKLELTWYWSEPPKGKARSKSPAPEAYGGPGLRTEAEDDESSARVQTWEDLGDDDSAAQDPVDLGPDYPDPDVAPLSHSMSRMALNSSQRGPLPAPPSATAGRLPHQLAYANAYATVNGHYSALDRSFNVPQLGRRASYVDSSSVSFAPSDAQGYNHFEPEWRSDFGETHGSHQHTIGLKAAAYSAVPHGQPYQGYAADSGQAPYGAQTPLPPLHYTAAYPDQRSALPSLPTQPQMAGGFRHAPLPQPPSVARPSATATLSHSQSMSSLQGPPVPPVPPTMPGHVQPPYFFPPPPAPPFTGDVLAGRSYDASLALPQPPQPPVAPPSMRRPPSTGTLPLPPSSSTTAGHAGGTINGHYPHPEFVAPPRPHMPAEPGMFHSQSVALPVNGGGSLYPQYSAGPKPPQQYTGYTG
ncbi:hypothetical protein OIV83_003589 [Microbotryomycetes sp. JL201]|nr:hypothetical protein OIV83_003589 [Microbotryomycetes sp. JL201]